ncbi:MAG TPA: response regulator [Myxococcota bacterium]|nr:response regulator [Myxococcota bacterium]HRY94365.1 response regulator [Myxococcota bacterium]HSA24057.1 response regulator [Myxococcota bacterium]
MPARKRILIVDDDPAVLEMLKTLLERSGYDVRTAANTIGAGYLLKDFSPDLVVLDIMLPGSLSGDQACDTLRSLCAGIKIVFYSGLTEDKLSELGAKHRADAVFAKGGRPSALVKAIGRLLGVAAP